MPKPTIGVTYSIYMVSNNCTVTLWSPPSTLLYQRQQLDRKVRESQRSFGSTPYIRWEGTDVLHLFRRSWVTSFYIA